MDLEQKDMNYNWYSTCSDEEFPISQYFFTQYKCFPSHLFNEGRGTIDKEFFKWLTTTYSGVKLHEYVMISKKGEFDNMSVWEFRELKAIFQFSVRDIEDADEGYEFEIDAEHRVGDYSMSVNIFYGDRHLLDEVKKKLRHFIITEKLENKISLVVQNAGGLTSRKFKIKIGEIDIGMNYGLDFVPVFNKIIKKLSIDNEKGLVLFHGLPGTGKTSLLKKYCSFLLTWQKASQLQALFRF